jgi:uncharacterized membrane protein
MRNKEVGYIIVCISIILFGIIWLFNFGVANIINATCSMGPTCSMYKTLSIQTWISILIALVVFIVGLVLIFSKEKERIVIRTEKKKAVDTSKLDKIEKQVVRILQEENGAIFQSSLMEKLGVGKVGITRLLDKLEAKQIIERKRRGMNNIVVLK